MICTWCRKDYSESSVYHICDDGTTFDQRREKTQYDFDENRATREMRRKPLTTDKNYDTVKWTTFDLQILSKARIKP